MNLVALGQIPHVKDVPLPPSILEFITGVVGQVCTMLVLLSSEEGLVQCMLTSSGQVVNEIITDMLVPNRISTSRPVIPRMHLLRKILKEPQTITTHTRTSHNNAFDQRRSGTSFHSNGSASRGSKTQSDYEACSSSNAAA